MCSRTWWAHASARAHQRERERLGETLTGVVGDRQEPLAEVAGLFIGYYRQTADEARARADAYFCIAAGVGVDLIPQWIDAGCSRAAAARLIPRPCLSGRVYASPESV